MKQDRAAVELILEGERNERWGRVTRVPIFEGEESDKCIRSRAGEEGRFWCGGSQVCALRHQYASHQNRNDGELTWFLG